mgnify:CR=1 FL=1
MPGSNPASVIGYLCSVSPCWNSWHCSPVFETHQDLVETTRQSDLQEYTPLSQTIGNAINFIFFWEKKNWLKYKQWFWNQNVNGRLSIVLKQSLLSSLPNCKITLWKFSEFWTDWWRRYPMSTATPSNYTDFKQFLFCSTSCTLHMTLPHHIA